MRNCLLPVLAIMLASCARGPTPYQAAQQQAALEYQKCPPSPLAANVRCTNEITARLLRPFVPRPDRLDLFMATQLSLAIKVDAGQMRKEDADTELARLKVNILDTNEQMALNRRSVNAQEAAAAPRSTVCTNMGGGMTVCN